MSYRMHCGICFGSHTSAEEKNKKTEESYTGHIKMNKANKTATQK